MGPLPKKLPHRGVVVGLSAVLAAGCSSTGTDHGDPPPEDRWYVTGVAGMQNQAFGLTLSGVQLLLDGKVVYSRTANANIAMVAGFNSTPLSVGNHVMTLKVLDQVGTSATYLVTGSVNMSLGQTGTETRSFRWPDQVRVLRVGDVVEFPFKVPL